MDPNEPSPAESGPAEPSPTASVEGSLVDPELPAWPEAAPSLAAPAPANWVPRLESALVLAVFAWIFVRHWSLVHLVWPFTADDAYITLRYSRHLAEGAGLVWNVGELPVEGYSNFTYVILGAGAAASGFDPVIVLKAVGAIASLVVLTLVFVLARFFVRPLPALVAPLLLSAHPGTSWWAVSGLETPVYSALALLAVMCLFLGLGHTRQRDGVDPPALRRYRGRWLSAAGLVAAVAAMTRPEGPAVFLILALVFALDAIARIRSGEAEATRRARRAAIDLVVPFGVLFGGYFVLRFIYYGRLWPNTVYCKGGFDGRSPWIQHYRYWETAAIPLLLALFTPLRRIDARYGALWGLPVLYGLLLIGVDPIVTVYDRHFLCAHAFVCIGAAVGAGWGLAFVFEDRQPQLRGLLVVCGVLIFQGSLSRTVARPMAKRIDDYPDRMANRADLGTWLDARMRPDETFVIGDAGMVPYLARAKVIDAYCLNAREMTRPPINRDTEAWADYILEQLPERIVVHSKSGTALRPRPEYDFFPVLIDDPRFDRAYEQEKIFPDPNYAYFVFKRRPPEEIEARRAKAEAAAKAKAEERRKKLETKAKIDANRRKAVKRGEAKPARTRFETAKVVQSRDAAKDAKPVKKTEKPAKSANPTVDGATLRRDDGAPVPDAATKAPK